MHFRLPQKVITGLPIAQADIGLFCPTMHEYSALVISV